MDRLMSDVNMSEEAEMQAKFARVVEDLDKTTNERAKLLAQMQELEPKCKETSEKLRALQQGKADIRPTDMRPENATNPTDDQLMAMDIPTSKKLARQCL